MFNYRSDLVSASLSQPSQIVENLKSVGQDKVDVCVGYVVAKFFKLAHLLSSARSGLKLGFIFAIDI